MKLGHVVGAFKSITAHKYVHGIKESGWPPFSKRLWQRNFFEHVIPSEASLKRIGEYIAGNTAQWELDSENPAHGWQTQV